MFDRESHSLSLMPGTFPMGIDEAGHGWRSITLTVRERAMLWFVNMITDKPLWWEKVHNDEIIAKWKSELDAFVAEGHDPLQNGFSAPMFHYCVRELRDKAAAYLSTANKFAAGGIVRVLDSSAGVYKADGRVHPSIVAALRSAAAKFENVPEDQKDWHPGSNDQVLDLVHPSLWPLVYGTSVQLNEPIGVDDAIAHIGAGSVVPVPTAHDLGLSVPTADDLGLSALETPRLWSERFQWLPAEVSFGGDGLGPAKITSYINNAHPTAHRDLYPVIEHLVDLALPMVSAAYQRTMSWAKGDMGDRERKRIPCDESTRTCLAEEYCQGMCDIYSAPTDDEAPTTEDEDEDVEDPDEQLEYAHVEAWFEAHHPISQPEPQAYVPDDMTYALDGPWFPSAARRPVGAFSDAELAEYKAENEARVQAFRERNGRWCTMAAEDVAAEESAVKAARKAEAAEAAEARFKDATEDDHRIQVIVKLANIHLTPEKPRYDGGSWHFEGQLNEHICATALFYYDSHNVTESRLAFRTMTDAEYYSQGGEFDRIPDDNKPFQAVYGMDPMNGRDSVAQELGDVVTSEGRLVVFPNVLQHRVQPFELTDRSKAGHRKIVALFFVDPALRVPSSATINGLKCSVRS